MNLQKNIRLTYELIKIKQAMPVKEFRECIEIVRNFILIETPEEFIFEALTGKLKPTQIRRLIDYEVERDRRGRTKVLMHLINRQFPKELVEQARDLELKEKQKALYQKRRKAMIRKAIKYKEWRKICAETAAQTSKVKSRKKPKKTFWNVSAETNKYKPKKWK
jgi:hypothetical protein